MHEAGHAVVAVHEGIGLTHISVNRDPREHPHESEDFMGGGAHLTSVDAFTALALSEPLRSIHFSLAGAASELNALGHTLPESFKEDMKHWRKCAGLRNVQTFESLEYVLGMSLVDAYKSTRELIAELNEQVIAVETVLSSARDWTLSYDEIKQIVGSA